MPNNPSPTTNRNPTPSIALGDSLESTLADLKLTPEEERVMAEELKQLRDLGKKLDENTIEIAAFGMVSRGKSSVLNALLGRDVFEVGATHGTTVNRSASGGSRMTASDQARCKPGWSWCTPGDRRGRWRGS